MARQPEGPGLYSQALFLRKGHFRSTLRNNRPRAGRSRTGLPRGLPPTGPQAQGGSRLERRGASDLASLECHSTLETCGASAALCACVKRGRGARQQQAGSFEQNFVLLLDETKVLSCVCFVG